MKYILAATHYDTVCFLIKIGLEPFIQKKKEKEI